MLYKSKVIPVYSIHILSKTILMVSKGKGENALKLKNLLIISCTNTFTMKFWITSFFRSK